MSLSKLNEKYSDLLESSNIINVDPGWYQIINEMLAAIKIYQDVNLGKCDLVPTVFDVIKTKHGWLDVQYCGGDEVIAEIVKFSRILSFKTCEKCGKMGNLYCSAKWMHWSNKRTLCTSHAVELYYYTIS